MAKTPRAIKSLPISMAWKKILTPQQLLGGDQQFFGEIVAGAFSTFKPRNVFELMSVREYSDLTFENFLLHDLSHILIRHAPQRALRAGDDTPKPRPLPPHRLQELCDRFKLPDLPGEKRKPTNFFPGGLRRKRVSKAQSEWNKLEQLRGGLEDFERIKKLMNENAARRAAVLREFHFCRKLLSPMIDQGEVIDAEIVKD